MRKSSTARRPTGVVRVDEVYTLAEITARLGLSKSALRNAQRAGLPVVKIGRRSYVSGASIRDHLDRQAKKARRRARSRARQSA